MFLHQRPYNFSSFLKTYVLPIAERFRNILVFTIFLLVFASGGNGMNFLLFSLAKVTSVTNLYFSKHFSQNSSAFVENVENRMFSVPFF